MNPRAGPTDPGSGDAAAVRWQDRPVSRGPGDGALPRTEAVKDEVTRRWDVATPAATRIGRPRDPSADLPERVRRLNDEQHPAMAGHGARMHHLEKLRIAHALCSALDVTPWERDRVLGLVSELDFRAFGSRRALPVVSLVACQYVVDDERRRQLGLDDQERVADLSPDEMAALYERFSSLKDDPTFRALCEEHDLDTTSVNRLNRVLRDQVAERGLEGAVLGHAAHRDPNLPNVPATDADGRGGDADGRGRPDGV